MYERFWTLAEERGGPPDAAVRITGQDELLVGARSGRLIAAMPQALVHQIPFDDIVAREVHGLRPAGVGSCRLAGNDNPPVEAFVQAVRQAPEEVDWLRRIGRTPISLEQPVGGSTARSSAMSSPMSTPRR